MYAAPLDLLGPIRGKRILLCGLGEEAVALAQAGADVYGFDICDTRVEAVKDLARRLGLRDQTHLQAMAFEHLPYPDGFFDLVLGRAMLHHIDLELGAKELARVLKRGGRAAFVDDHPLTQRDVDIFTKAFGSAVRGEWMVSDRN